MLSTACPKPITCDQASFLFFRDGKERLIQLLDYSSAAPAIMSAMPLDKNEPVTGSRVVGGNYNGLTTATALFDVALAVRPI